MGRRVRAVRARLAAVAEPFGVSVTPAIPNADPNAAVVLAFEDLAAIIEHLAGLAQAPAPKARKTA
jgi:hypothetical protein